MKKAVSLSIFFWKHQHDLEQLKQEVTIFLGLHDLVYLLLEESSNKCCQNIGLLQWIKYSDDIAQKKQQFQFIPNKWAFLYKTEFRINSTLIKKVFQHSVTI